MMRFLSQWKPGINLGLFKRWFLTIHFGQSLVYFLGALALIAGVATFYAMNDVSPNAVRPSHVIHLIYLDCALILILAFVVVRRLAVLWIARREGRAGSRLHVRLVATFGVLAIAPAVMMAFFSIASFDKGLEAWFNDKNRIALHQSLAVAKAYLNEHHNTIRADVESIARDLSHEPSFLFKNSRTLNKRLYDLIKARSLSEAIIFDEGHQVVARSPFTFALEFERMSEQAMDLAKSSPVMLTSENGDRVRALIHIHGDMPYFLYVGRDVDANILAHVARTQQAVSEFDELDEARTNLKALYVLIFMGISLLILLTAIWLGLTVADHLVRPIGQLIKASDRIRSGDLSARVPAVSDREEIGKLSRAFNKMATELDEQHQNLVEANAQMETKKAFTENVLAGVTSGVIALNARAHIDLANRSACELLGRDLSKNCGEPIESIVPELRPYFENNAMQGQNLVQFEITRMHDGHPQTLFMRIVPAFVRKKITGFVVTFDDITELLVAQRKAAWSDVARRIAHEIRNPLTPIRLAAERLRKKFAGEISNDAQIFQDCIATIIRQVGDIGKMVDEFSSFARMPLPAIENLDLDKLCRQGIALQQEAHPNIHFSILNKVGSPLWVSVDPRMINQAITNLFLNAIQSIEERIETDQNNKEQGAVSIMIEKKNPYIMIQVDDNGLGLPKEGRSQLTEPYVTTKIKGTGLGLAIVKKVVEEHGGYLELKDSEGSGASVSIAIAQSLNAAVV